MRKYTLPNGLEFTADDIVNPDDRDYDYIPFVVSEAIGYSFVVRGIVFADNAQEAMDIIVDAGKLDPIPDEDYSDYGVDTENPQCAFLGNASEPFDLDHIDCYAIDIGDVQEALNELDTRVTHRIGSEFGRSSLPCTVIEKPVYCPNASTIGYSVRWAEPGFFLAIKEGYSGNLARMIGFIEEPKNSVGRILALVLADNGHSCFERWIDPKDVLECHEKAPAALWAFFTGPLPDPRITMGLAHHGTLSGDHAKHIDARIEEFKRRLLWETRGII